MSEDSRPTRQVSVAAMLARETAMRKWAERDALLLQDDLFAAQEQIRQLTAELEAERTKNGNAS